jgi:signal peptidase II
LKVLLISAVIFLADQLSKLFIKGISVPLLGINFSGISIGDKFPLVSDNISITLLENPGFAFGIYPGIEYKFILTLLTLFITMGLFVYLYKSRNDSFVKRFAAALLIGGAAGNLTDRIFYGVIYDYAPLFYGSVVDFISIRIPDIFYFSNHIGSYIFNLADLSVAAGLIMMIFSLQTSEKTAMENLAAENQD